MKASFTKNFFLACAALFSFSMLNAQSVFWSEDFSSAMDLPSGWTTADDSGGAGAWIWCNDPTATNPCIANWAAYSNQHDMGFFAETADNGYVLMDSDALGSVSPDHVVQITTGAIDCSGQTDVWVKFESLIGVFGLDADPNAIIRVSTDGMNWTDFQVFEGLTTAERWSENPQISLVDISPVAAGSGTVYVQWQWTGNYEYYWLVDDVELYDADPTPIFVLAHDMRVNDNFYAIAPNAVTPASQVEQFGFLADIENVGFQDQTNVNLNVTIVDDASSASVYTEDLFYGTIEADSLAENVLFADAGFTPEATPGKTYTGTYTVSSDSIDLDPENDVQIFDFAVSDTSFQKEMGATRFISPADGNWDDGEFHSWAYGNCFYVTSGDGLYARTGSFTVGNAADVAGKLLEVALYTWVDANEDLNADPDERTKIGTNFYAISGFETDEDIITLPLLDPATSMLGEIALADDTYYIIMLEYTTVDEVNFVMMGSEDYDYSAMAFRSEELMTPRLGSMLGVAGDLTAEPYSSIGFGRDVVPVVRMSIGTEPLMMPDNVNDVLADENKISVSPNPADDFINVNLDLVEAQDEALIRIMDVTGKVITERVYDNVQNETYTYNVSNFVPGTYFVNFISEAGSRSIRFVVAK